MTTFAEDICTTIKSRAPFIALESPDELRLTQLVKEATGGLTPPRTYYQWSITKGLMKEVPNPQGRSSVIYPFIGSSGRSDADARPETVWKMVDDYPEPDKTCCVPIDGLAFAMKIPAEEHAVIFMRDFTPYMALTYENGPRIQRKLRDCYEYLKGTKKTLVFTSPRLDIPQELKELFTIIEVPYPNAYELREIFNKAYNGAKKHPDPTFTAPLEAQIKGDPQIIDKIISYGRGLSAEAFESVVSKQLVMKSFDLSVLRNEKKQRIKEAGLLEWWEPSSTLADVGGLENLKRFVEELKLRSTPEAVARGVTAPKTVLFIGPPGTGKTLTAKVIAAELGLPLVTLNMASLTSKYLGETGNKLIAACKQADAMAPVVLLVDEVEKGLSQGNGTGMHEELQRAFGGFLTYLQESNAPVLKIFTSNNPIGLPNELVSRFEVSYWVGIPTQAELRSIYKVQISNLAGKKRDPTKFDLDKLAKESAGYVGREIEVILKEANAQAFLEGHPDITMDHILRKIHEKTPLSKQKGRKESMEAMREWVGDGVLPASAPDVESIKTEPVNGIGRSLEA